ncbi:NIN-like protein [Artemisia annua]|uniref:NIN-like protein n=1 Tax=Artemisia annua TaxID=35608 RepID=A0A2U1NXB0_ARTAN|nr:NIN-like protein [Artemisia annua]
MVDLNFIDQQMIKEKITSVLSALRFREQHVLVQFWSPVTVGNHCLLMTLNQPFGLGVVNDEGIYLHRLKSEQDMFDVDEEFGSPARVYQKKSPEWSFDIQNLSTRQSNKDLAACYNIHGYIMLPIFEPNSGWCVGVLELVTSSSNYVDYAFEVQEISRALKEENLKSPNVFEDPRIYKQVSNERRCHELAEICIALKTVCDTHKLPLAQTWSLSGNNSFVANSGQLEQTCSSFKKSCIGKICMSTANLPFYVRDVSMWGFHEACIERHLEKSRGVVGRSMLTCGSWFCKDVTELDEDDYSLVPFARMSRLTSCLAIYIKSIELASEYVIEFFLPTLSTNEADQQFLVKTVKQQIKNVFQLGSTSTIQEIGAVNMESQPSPLTLLAVSDVPRMSVNIENEPSNSGVAGACHTVVPYLEKGVTYRKRECSGSSISLEEIKKHFGKPIGEAAAYLNVSRSTLKGICKAHGIPRWPYRNLESPPSQVTLLTEVGVSSSEPGNQQLFFENEQNDKKKQSEVPNLGHIDDNMENMPFNSAAAAVPCLDVGLDFDISKGKTGRNYDNKSNKPMRKMKRTGISVGLEEISEPCEETMKVIEDRLLEVPRMSETSEYESCNSDAVGTSHGVVPYLKKRTTQRRRKRSERVITLEQIQNHTVEPIDDAAAILKDNISMPSYWHGPDESLGTRKLSHDPATVAQHGKNNSTHQQEQTNMPDVRAQPKTSVIEQYIENTAANTMKDLTVKATYKENTVKFPFILSDGLVKLEKLIATRFLLSLGSFKLKYEDKDGDMILVACDTDLEASVGDSRQPVDPTIIRLLVFDRCPSEP